MVDGADVDGRAHARLLGDAASKAGHAAHATSLSRAGAAWGTRVGHARAVPITYSPAVLDRRLLLVAAAATALAGACRGDAPPPRPIKFLHTFGPEETEVFNALVRERGMAVESSLVPFARGQQVIGEILRGTKGCPDLIRIDATWLLGLATANLVQPVPDALAKLDWTPEAAALMGGPVLHGVPQTVDGLVVVRDSSRPAPASARLADLVAAARATKTATSPYPLGVRVDGYWFVPWLRAEGGELAPTVDAAAAERAVAAFAALFGDVAPPPPPSGSEKPDELRRWNAHEVAYWVTGPWQLGVLEDRERLVVTPLARAPRGGQVLVVPTCASDPAGGWRLARELTEPTVQLRFATAFSAVPTRMAALAGAPPLVRSIYEALKTAEPLPASPNTPLLFDDLNPALAAVIAGDATAAEVVDGIRRGWQRIARAPAAERAP